MNQQRWAEHTLHAVRTSEARNAQHWDRNERVTKTLLKRLRKYLAESELSRRKGERV